MHFKSIPLENDLLKVLFDEIHLLPKDDLARAIVVLPTARLGTYLKAALAKNLGAYLAPKIVNWHQMLGLFWDQESEDQIVSPEIAEYLLKSTIKSIKARNLAAYHAHELLQLFNDFENAGGSGQYIDRLRKEILPTRDFALEHLALLEERLEEIEDLRIEFYNRLQINNLTTKARWKKLAAQAVLKSLKSQDFSKLNKIYIAGLTTMNVVQMELLDGLAQKNNVKILLSQTPILHKLAKFNPLGEIHRAISKNVHNSAHLNVELKREAFENNLTNIKVFEFETPFHEVCTIISEIRELVLTRGVPPSQIAILLTSEAEYGAYLRENTPNKEFSTNFAIAYAFSDSPLGRLFVALNRVVSEELACESILSMLTHPLFLNQMKFAEESREYSPKTSSDLNLLLVQAACNIDPPESSEKLRCYVDRLFRKAKIEFKLEGKIAWEELVHALDEPQQTNTRWIALLERFLQGFGLENLAEVLPKEKSKGLYLSANASFHGLLEQFMSLQNLWPQSRDLESFF